MSLVSNRPFVVILAEHSMPFVSQYLIKCSVYFLIISKLRSGSPPNQLSFNLLTYGFFSSVFSINFILSSTISGVDYYIEFEVIAKDSAGDLVGEEGTASWNIGGKTYTQKVKNGRNSFKVDEYLDPALDGDGNKIVLMLTMNTGGVNDTTVSKTWYVKAVDLKLNWNWFCLLIDATRCIPLF